MKLKSSTKRRALSLMGSPVMGVEINDVMLQDIYKDAINKFEFYSKLKNKKFKRIKKYWIENFFQANLKESTARVRGKYKGKLPIPGAELSLEHKELLLESQNEKQHLISLFFLNE